MQSGWYEAAHFMISACSVAAALLVIAGLLWFVRRAGWRGPVEIITFLEMSLGLKPHEAETRTTVNIEFRDAGDAVMDLGPLVAVTLQNGRGKSYALHNGIFADCYPGWIKAGAQVHITVQDGLLRERLAVQLDLERQTLFVKSRFYLADVVANINHHHPPVHPHKTRRQPAPEHCD